MICCLNPDCKKPENPNHNQICQSCHTPLVQLLRNRFRVIRLLSDEGGFGRTYLSEDTDKLNELCVIKQLAPKFKGTWSHRKAIQLFSEEAKRLQELGEHPQIPTLLAYFEQDNCLYLVQQFIDGHNLFTELNSRKIYRDWDIQSILIDLLPVIKFIHQRGVIHRDIKPENIIRRKTDGRLTLIDFGSAKQFSTKVQRKHGTSIGSHGYSPIEQIRDGKAYPASDLFSLGATCFHLLTGVSPFQLWLEYGYSWVNNWQDYLPFILSPELTEVMDKLLQKEIQHRYQSADEVLKVFMKKHTHLLPSSSNEIIPIPGNIHHKLPHQYLWLLNLFIMFGVITFFAVGEFSYREFRKLPIDVIAFLKKSNNQKVAANQSTQILHKNLFLLNTISSDKNKVLSLAISPDNKMIVTGEDVNGNINNIKLWDVMTGRQITSLSGHLQNVNKVVISDDGKTLVSASDDTTIKVWNLINNKLVYTLDGHTDAVHGLAISTDGKTLVSASDDTTIKVWNLITGQLISTLSGHNDWIRSVDIHGTILASASFDKTLKLWHIDQQNTQENTQETLATSTQTFINVAFSPDGKILAGVSRDRTIKLWEITTGKQILTIKAENNINTIAFSPDGKILASGGRERTIKLWEVSTGKQILSFPAHNHTITSLVFTSDGKLLISGSEDHLIKIWQVSQYSQIDN